MPKRTVSLEFDDDVLRAARRQALDENRQLADYLTELIKRDLNMPLDDGMTVINTAGVHNFVPDREVGETREEYKQRKELFEALLGEPGED